MSDTTVPGLIAPDTKCNEALFDLQATLKRDGSFSTCMFISRILIGLLKHEGCCEAAVAGGGCGVCVRDREKEREGGKRERELKVVIYYDCFSCSL